TRSLPLTRSPPHPLHPSILPTLASCCAQQTKRARNEPKSRAAFTGNCTPESYSSLPNLIS
ncbi:hypothetical protein SERLA73DRAFT_145081, partial [Serpula lacrymans var. lacrymans S7.3]